MHNSNVTQYNTGIDPIVLQELQKSFTEQEIGLLSLPTGKELQFINESGIFPAD